MNTANLPVSLVDDDSRVCEAWGTILLSRGYAVQTFDSGEAFLASARSSQAGCVLLDLRMDPGMNGLQVFDEMRKRGSPSVVIFLSGHGSIQDSVRAMKGGAADDRVLAIAETAGDVSVWQRARNREAAGL